MLINRITGLDIKEFIQNWDNPQSYRNTINHEAKKSIIGNINNTGDPASAAAPVVTRYHPEFFSFVEEGVLDLVKLVIHNLNYITFLSCQGHPAYYANHKLIELRPRQVSILPRNEGEAEEIWLLFHKTCQKTNKAIRTDKLLTKVEKQRLEIFNKEYTRYWMTISLTFEPLDCTSEAYFKDLEEVYRSFLRHLSTTTEHPAIPTN